MLLNYGLVWLIKMKLLLKCVKCNQKHIIEFIEKDIPKFYVKDVYYNGKIISEKNIDLLNVFDDYDNIQCYNCHHLIFKIKAIYN